MRDMSRMGILCTNTVRGPQKEQKTINSVLKTNTTPVSFFKTENFKLFCVHRNWFSLCAFICRFVSYVKCIHDTRHELKI